MRDRLADALKRAIAGNRAVALVVLVLAAVTLRPGGGGSGSTGCLICGERGLADFISNIILFAPLGAAIALRKGKYWHALAVGVLLSLTIEAAQWRLVAGRDSNLGDIVANTLGVMLGWTFVWTRPFRSLGPGGALRAYGVAVVTVGVLLGALTLFSPALSRSLYYVHWTPAYESLERYHGTILTTRLEPMAWSEGPHARMEPADSVSRLLGRVPLQIRFIAGPPPSSLAPLLSISDENQEEVVMIGVNGSDLIYRYRTRADDLRLDDANLRVPHVFRGLERGDTVEMATTFSTEGYCVAINDDTSCGRGFSVGHTWSLLLDPDWSPRAYRAFGIFWLWVAFLPCGLLTVPRRTLVVIAGGTALGLVAGPALLGFTPTPWYEIAGALLGLFVGHALGGRRSTARKS